MRPACAASQHAAPSTISPASGTRTVIHPQSAVERPPEAHQRPNQPLRRLGIVVHEKSVLVIAQQSAARPPAPSTAHIRQQTPRPPQPHAHARSLRSGHSGPASPIPAPAVRKPPSSWSASSARTAARSRRTPNRPPQPRQPHRQVQRRQHRAWSAAAPESPAC